MKKNPAISGSTLALCLLIVVAVPAAQQAHTQSVQKPNLTQLLASARTAAKQLTGCRALYQLSVVSAQASQRLAAAEQMAGLPPSSAPDQQQSETSGWRKCGEELTATFDALVPPLKASAKTPAQQAAVKELAVSFATARGTVSSARFTEEHATLMRAVESLEYEMK